MTKLLQIKALHNELDVLNNKFGDVALQAIYGAGEIKSPNLMLIFMNPTARNISAHKTWQGLRAPWIGTKEVWKMIRSLNIISDPKILNKVIDLKPEQWDETLAFELYSELAQNSIYITNIAKCTQIDARALPNSTFKAYLPSMLEEIYLVNPRSIICFGNQVSSILLSKPVSVSNYKETEHEILMAKGKKFTVYPTYYPVGQGMRNMPKAVLRLHSLKKFRFRIEIPG